MRHSYTTKEIAHKWLYEWKEIEHGHTSENRINFLGNTIYRYGKHFPIAQVFEKGGEYTINCANQNSFTAKITVPKGQRGVILFTDRDYSNTTAKPQWTVKRAIPEEEFIIIKWGCYRFDGTPAQYFKERIIKAGNKLREKSQNIRSPHNLEWQIRTLEEEMQNYRHAGSVFGFSTIGQNKKWLKLMEEQRMRLSDLRAKYDKSEKTRLENHRRKILNWFNTPLYHLACMIRQSVADGRVRTDLMPEVVAMFERTPALVTGCGWGHRQHATMHTAIHLWKEEQEAGCGSWGEEFQKFKDLIQNSEDKKILLQQWRDRQLDGNQYYGRYAWGTPENKILSPLGLNRGLDIGTRLRLSKDGKSIETSLGAYVQLEHARVAYKAWKMGQLRPGDRIGNYTVISTNGDHTFKIGCHTIPHEEIELLATQLKWNEKN